MAKFRTKYDLRHVGLSFKDVTKLTDSQFKNDCTIEGIIKRYGILPRPDVAPVGADVSDLGDFDECMRKVQEGLDTFNALPSDVRARFGNDPSAFCSWIADSSNVEEACRIGLMVKRVEEKSVSQQLSEISDGISKMVNSKESISA